MNSGNDANSPNANSVLSATGAEMSQISIKLPVFPKKNIKLWFAQVEAQFTTWKITAEKSKFAYVAGQLEHDVAERVADLILAPPESNPYTALKNRLINELEESEQRRLRRLLEELKLEDKKPSVLLREMRSYAADKVNDEFLKELFIQRLPAHVRAILAPLNLNLQEVAATADKILESATPSYSVAAISTPAASSSDAVIASLAQQVAQLTTAVQKLMENSAINDRGRSPNRVFRRNFSPYRARSRSRNKNQNEDGVCWYHRKFAEKATKCTTPCSFVKSSEN